MDTTYSIVTLDGKEHSDLQFETVKNWYFQKRINDESFILSAETGEWKLLKKVFDTAVWKKELWAQNMPERSGDIATSPPVHPVQATVNHSEPVNPQTPAHSYSAQNISAAGQNTYNYYDSVGNYEKDSDPGLNAAAFFLLIDIVVAVGAMIFMKQYQLLDLLSPLVWFGEIFYLAVRTVLIYHLFKSSGSQKLKVITLVYYAASIVLGSFMFFGMPGNMEMTWYGISAVAVSLLSMLIVLATRKANGTRVFVGFAVKFLSLFLLIYFYYSLAPLFGELQKMRSAMSSGITDYTYKSRYGSTKIALPKGWQVAESMMMKCAPSGGNCVSTPNSLSIFQSTPIEMFAADFRKREYMALERSDAGIPINDQEKLKAELKNVAEKYATKISADAADFQIISSTPINLYGSTVNPDALDGSYPAHKIILERKTRAEKLKFTTHLIVFYNGQIPYILQMWSFTSDYRKTVSDFQRFEATLKVN